MNVAVVIVTYNGAQWLNKCIGYTLSESVGPRLIVIDNGSTDNTVAMIGQNYPEVELIRSGENLGFGKANNIGIKKAYESGASHILLLNQDAWLEQGALEKLIQVQVANPSFDIISPMHLNGKGTALDYNFSTFINAVDCRNLYSDIFTGNYSAQLYEAKFVNAACWLLSRKCIETIGGFSPVFYHYAEDDNYIHRLHYHKLRLGVYPFVKMFHDRPQVGESAFHQKDRMQKRVMMLKYSNPNSSITINEDIKIYGKSYFKYILKLDFKNAQKISALKKELENLAPEINNFLSRSKQKGLIFLG